MTVAVLILNTSHGLQLLARATDRLVRTSRGANLLCQGYRKVSLLQYRQQNLTTSAASSLVNDRVHDTAGVDQLRLGEW